MYAVIVDIKRHMAEKSFFGYELIRLNGVRPKAGIHLFMKDYFYGDTVVEEEGKSYTNADYSVALEVKDWKPVPKEHYEIMKEYMNPHEISETLIEEAEIEEL